MRIADPCLTPKYHLLVNLVSATVALVYMNVQLEHKLSISTRFGQFQNFQKF